MAGTLLLEGVQPIAGWDAKGAIPLAEALPPAYADLPTELLRRHR